VRAMAKQNVVTIERLEVSRSDINKIKRVFKVKDNAEAMKRALEVATGKIELEAIFDKFKGTKIQKIYA
jgi:hypothetical protein